MSDIDSGIGTSVENSLAGLAVGKVNFVIISKWNEGRSQEGPPDEVIGIEEDGTVVTDPIRIKEMKVKAGIT